MKIAYIAAWDAYQNSGVLTKLIGQVASANNLGVEAVLFLVSPRSDSDIFFANDQVRIIESKFSGYFNGTLKTYLSKLLTVSCLKNEVSIFQPDIVYYRQGMWYPGLVRALSSVCPYIVEVNTDDEKEAQLFGVFKRFFYLNTRKFLLENSSGFVAVTDEIASKLKVYGKPTISIGNGIDSRDIIPRQATNNVRPQLVFVGSPGYDWHGIDKLPVMAKLFREFDFHVVGYSGYSKYKNLLYHGYLGREKLRDLYQGMDVGLGTLALYRKGMEEACPLKVREYIAFGLPVIIGYYDKDIDGEDFVLNIGNTENNVEANVAEIRDFVFKMMNVTVRSDKVDSKNKEKSRVDFLKFIHSISH